MTIRAKFVLKSVEQQKMQTSDEKGNWVPCITHTYKFQAVYGDSPENKSFWKFTPAGELTLTSVNPQDWSLGEEYYLDISKCLVAA